jgi:cytochrome c peroxidase
MLDQSNQSATKKRRLPRWAWFLIIPLGILLILVVVLGALPINGDPEIAEAEWGAGANNIEPSWTGLQREWPQLNGEVDPAIANLGHQLFFDPILSGDNTYACANCHHPDMGFSNGQTVGVGPHGEELNRNVPTLWNVGFNDSFFWDGRANSLEEQMIVPITAENEMGQDLEELVAELSQIEAYQTQFDALFTDGVTSENIATAIATFERTLISDGSAFDQYVNGEFDALTTQQRRGFGIFRSAGTRCFECHSLPTFVDENFKVIGVPDNGTDDRGVGDAVEGGVDYAFKIPTLRNVALNAPYMHNGHFATLAEVIDFYSDGAGRGVGFEGAEIDRHVAPGFTLSEQEIADVVAFLYALTDETIAENMWQGLDYVDEEGHIIIPAEVPSGAENLVQPMDNPAREVLAEAEAEPSDRPECERDAATQTVTVQEGQTIQQAIDCAVTGDTILVPPGIYRERVLIDLNGITLRGMVDEEPATCPVQSPEAIWPEGDAAPNWPILEGDIDGDGVRDLTDGIIASGNNFRMEYFVARNFTGNGVLVEGVRGVTLRHLFTANTGLYGVYPVRSNDVLVECTVVTLATDAGIYVGQSQDIIVRNNLAYDNLTGIEIENSVNAEVYNNETWNNTGGLLVFLLPNLHSRVSNNISVHDNYIHNNNRHKDDATPGSIVADVPIGTGILVMATDDSEFYNNRIENNRSGGIAIVSLYQAYEENEIGDVGPLSENNYVHDNQFTHNGYDPDTPVTDAGLPGTDVLWDATGYGNVFDEPDAKMFPPVLPSENWPEFAQRVIYQVWNNLGKLLG